MVYSESDIGFLLANMYAVLDHLYWSDILDTNKIKTKEDKKNQKFVIDKIEQAKKILDIFISEKNAITILTQFANATMTEKQHLKVGTGKVSGKSKAKRQVRDKLPQAEKGRRRKGPPVREAI